ncbi:MAG: Gx transporter family protein [Bacilli bacterium]
MRKNITISIYILLAVGLSAVETVILPTSIIPGVKLGIANLVVIVSLYQFGIRISGFISLVRVIVISLVLGTFLTPSFLISLSGMTISFIGLVVAYKSKVFSAIGVSVVAAVFHIIGQVIAVIVLTNLNAVLVIAPFLIYVAIVTGFIIGYVARKILAVSLFKMGVYDEF